MDRRSAPTTRTAMKRLPALALAALLPVALAGARANGDGSVGSGIVPWKSPGLEQRSGASLQNLVRQSLQPLDPLVLRRQLRQSATRSEAATP